MILNIKNISDPNDAILMDKEKRVPFLEGKDGIEARIEPETEYMFYRRKEYDFLKFFVRVFVWLFLPMLDLLRGKEDKRIIDILDLKCTIDAVSAHSILKVINDIDVVLTEVRMNGRLKFMPDSNVDGTIRYGKQVENKELQKIYNKLLKQNILSCICSICILILITFVSYELNLFFESVLVVGVVWMVVICFSCIYMCVRSFIQYKNYIAPMEISGESDYYSGQRGIYLRLSNLTNKEMYFRITDNKGLEKKVCFERRDVYQCDFPSDSDFVMIENDDERVSFKGIAKWQIYLYIVFGHLILNRNRRNEVSFESYIMENKEWKYVIGLDNEKNFIDYTLDDSKGLFIWKNRYDKLSKGLGVSNIIFENITKEDFKIWKKYVIGAYLIVSIISILLAIIVTSTLGLIGGILILFVCLDFFEIFILLDQGKMFFKSIVEE